MHYFSSFWQLLHDITILFTKYFNILHHLQTMKMIFLKVFLTCTFKDPNLAEKFTNLAENLFKKVDLHWVQGVCFFKVWLSRKSLTSQPLKNFWKGDTIINLIPSCSSVRENWIWTKYHWLYILLNYLIVRSDQIHHGKYPYAQSIYPPFSWVGGTGCIDSPLLPHGWQLAKFSSVVLNCSSKLTFTWLSSGH